MPARSFLEVIGAATMLHNTGKGSVMKIPLRISCNVNTPTIDGSRESRKTQILAMVDHTSLEINRDLETLRMDPRVFERAKSDHHCTKDAADKYGTCEKHLITEEPSITNSGLIDQIKAECAAFRAALLRHDAMWFIDDAQHKRAVEEAADLRRLAVGKLMHWLENSHVDANSVRKASMYRVDRQKQSRMEMKLQAVKRERDDSQRLSVTLSKGGSISLAEEVKSRALQICRDRGLIAAEVDDNNGITPLMRYAGFGSKDSVVLLLDAGEDPSVVDSQGYTALHHAAEAGHPETIQAIVEEGGQSVERSSLVEAKQSGGRTLGRTPIVLAADGGHTAAVETLVKLGADVNAVDDDGYSALIRAGKNGHTSTVQALVGCKANVHATNNSGTSAIVWAERRGHRATVEALVKLGAERPLTGYQS